MNPHNYICVISSHGTLRVNRDNGEVLEFNPDSDRADDLSFIARFDLPEWIEYWKKPLIGHVDILDLGYWTQTGEFEPPEADFRREIVACQTT